MRKLALVLLGFSLISMGIRAQEKESTAAPAFEVASIKPSSPNANSPLGMIPMVLPGANGRFSATNVPLRLLVRMAYGLQDFQIDGGPSWQMSQRFDIVAKAEDGFAGSQQAMLPMVKTLLVERFKLKVHTEMRDMPIWHWSSRETMASWVRHLKPSTSDCSNAQAEQQKLADALAKGGPGALAGMLAKPGETRPCMMMPTMGADGFGMRADGQPLSVMVQLLTQATGASSRTRPG